MAVISKGVTRGLTVLNGTDGGVNLPVNAEAVIKRQVALEDFVKNFVRTGGKGKLQRDGNVYYSIFAKANLDREITTTSDGSVVTAGMYGAEGATPGSAGSTFGYVAPTTVKVYTDFVSLTGGRFMKELITSEEQEQENLPTLATDRISTYQNGNAERIINEIKLAMVEGVGMVGKAATDAGWTATDSRQVDADYSIDEAGGLAAYNDIDAAVGTLLNIGRMGSAEEDYPFARGASGADITLAISRNVNRALTIAFKESPSGTFPGMTVDAAKGDVLNLFGCKVVKIEAMPAKSSAPTLAFNWLLITTGENGAIAMPSVFDLNFVIRPHYEGVSILGDIIEGKGGSWATKFFQPELMVGSFRKTVATVTADAPQKEVDSITLSDDEVIVSKKDLAKTATAIKKAQADAKELKDLKAKIAKDEADAIKKAEEAKNKAGEQ